MEFSGQEYWSELPCPPPGDLPDPGIKPMSLESPALACRYFTLGFPGWLGVYYILYESTCQCRRLRRLGFDAWARKIPWRRKWQPTPVFLSGNSMDRGAWWVTVHVVPRVGHDWAHMRIPCLSSSTLPLSHIHSSHVVATAWSQLCCTVFMFPRLLLPSRIFMFTPLSHLIKNWTKFLRSNENIMSCNHWGRTTHSITRNFAISCLAADSSSLIWWFLFWSMRLPATDCEQLERQKPVFSSSLFPGPHTVIAGVPNKSLLLQLYKTKQLFFIKHHTILTVKFFPRFISIISLSLEFPTDSHCGFSTVSMENILAFIFHTGPKI